MIPPAMTDTEATAPKQISRIRRITPVIAIIASTLGVAFYKYDESAKPRLLLGPMVQMPAANALAIVWTAHSGRPAGWARLTLPDGKEIEQQINPGGVRYEAEFAELRHGVTYEYEIFNEGLFGRRVKLSGPHKYKMPPHQNDGAFRFAVLGDSGVGGNTQAIVARMIAEQSPPPNLLIHVGDLIYPAGESADYPLHFYLPNAPIISTIPFLPCLGNHDVATDTGRPLLAEFMLPRNGPEGIEAERNYYFDYGDARFVAIDTNIDRMHGAVTEDQLKTVVGPWLRTVLKASDANWKFVYFHHPYYTGSQHISDHAPYIKQALVDVIEECNVDVVFCGHNHLYERTAPIRDEKVVEEGEGVVYITTGAGGAQRYPEILPPPEYIRVYNDRDFSFTCVDVDSNTVLIRQINEKSVAFDQYSLEKSARP